MQKLINILKSFFVPVGHAIIKCAKYIHERSFLEYSVFTLIMYFTVDVLSRRSFAEPFVFIFESPLIFIFNFLIVAFTMSLSLIFYHRYFFYVVNAVIWLTLSITNFVLQSMRVAPFSAIDLKVVLTAFDVIPKYIGWGGIILILAAFVFAGFMLVLLWRKCPIPTCFNRKKAIIITTVIAVILSGLVFYTSYTDYIPDELESAVESYDDYGFPYCFIRSIVQRGVVSPDEYSEEHITELMNKLGDKITGKTADELPNVIFLQLESFFDVNKVKELEISENPIPVFTELRANNPTGKFSVNAIGGGTANTEFEVLCGMNLAHFGLLDCPYTTILHKMPCQSTASVMNAAGFTSHAIHNHTATFYSRHLVYPNLGFNTFTPIEYIKNVETNMLGWAKDKHLTGEIISALESTDGKDFVFTVSVQPHGRYPNYETASENDIQVTAYPYEDKIYEVEYYINQLHETDVFLGELIDVLEDYPEDIVLVVYGDHLPTLGLEAEDMFDGDVYSTEYLIWSNCGFNCDSGDIQAYQLSAKVLSALGVEGGEMFRIHRLLSDDPNYDNYVQLMAYDMLKGDNYALGERIPIPTELTLGTKPISISTVSAYDDIVFVSGQNFTKDSHIFIDDKRYDTVYISDTLLLAKDAEIDADVEIYVAQLCEGSTLLSHTDPIIYDNQTDS